MMRKAIWAIGILWVCLGLPAQDARAQTKQIDLNGDGVAESKVVTKVLQSYPIKIQNVVYNEATGQTFTFAWRSAAPGGFTSSLAPGPGVGTKHVWTTAQQVFSFVGSTCPTDICFTSGTGVARGPFSVTGKSIFPTAVTTSGSVLTSSTIVFFSPPQDRIKIDDIVLDGRIETTVHNPLNVNLELDIAEQNCCPFERMTICEDGCKFYLTDPDNCGGCGIQCGQFAVCVDGTCEPDCPEGLTLCGEECVDTDVDLRHCGGCDNACGDNEICDLGTCEECRPPEGTACPIPALPFQAECVRIHQDPQNCGACGVRCDLLNCPSGGQGTCSQGNSCHCTPGGDSTDSYRVLGPPTPDAVVEATVCAASQVEDLTVAPGQSETFCRFLPPTTLTEERVTVYDVTVGGFQTSGTAIQRVPDLERPIGPVEVVYSGLFVDDGPTGDGVVQPGETFRLTIQLQNLGPQPLEDITGTLSAPATAVNPGCSITFSQATSAFPDLAGCTRTGTYDCDNPPPPCPEVENVTQFVGTVNASCPLAAFGLPMTLTLSGTTPTDGGTDNGGLGPVAGIGIGESCDPATDIDGQTYDGIDGLQSPVSAHLTLDPEFVNFSSSPVKKGSVPLKFQLYCGSRVLRCQDLDSASRIVSLEHETLGSLPLTSINASNSNPNDPFFGCNSRNQRQEFNFNVASVPKGNIIIGIEMPDSRRYFVGIRKQ